MDIVKSAANTLYFFMQDTSGLPVTGCESDTPDSEVSKDGGAFADCTNEISAVGGGLYSLSLTDTECNCDVLALKVGVATGTTRPYCAVFRTIAAQTSDRLSAILTAAQDKAGYSLSAAGVDAILDEVVEGSYTMRQLLRLIAAVQLAKSTGGGTATIVFRDLADTKNRISATVDVDNNRTALTLDAS